MFYLGVDLGQTQDWTAISVVEYVSPNYHVRWLERPDLGTPYPAIVERIGNLLKTINLSGNQRLIVDATGVGKPVIDMLRKARLKPVAVTITGGDSITHAAHNNFRVPKRDLVTTLQVLFQMGHIKIADSLPLAPQFIEELLSFHVNINLKTAHDSYEAWREGIHDDLVLSVALATWFGEREISRPKARVSFIRGYSRSRHFL
jgi:hypothetical protein